MEGTERPGRVERLLPLLLQGLFILAFLTGGSSQISGWDDAAVQLLALPILVLALWQIGQAPGPAHRNVAIGAAVLVLAVPVLQLLPISDSVWLLPEARQRLAQDLAAVGAVPGFRWSLDPAATERAALFLLPPVAAFLGMFAVGRDTHRRMLRTVMLAVLFSLLLAFAQFGVPAESALNPFPEWAAKFNGVFANQNHQGIALVVGMVIALTGMLASLPSRSDSMRAAWTPWVLGFVALFMLCALPLTQSRASLLIGTFAVAAVPLAMGMFDRRHLRSSWAPRAGLAACAAIVAIGVWGTVGWMQVDMVDELRAPLRDATRVLARDHLPLGTGMGAFVAAFEQGIPDHLLLANYVNHAHNDFLQVWMEAGWIGLCAMVLALALLAFASARGLVRSGQDRSILAPAILGLAALLLHSWVDYPMRTGSLAIVAAVLAGVILSGAAVRRQRRDQPVVGENRDGRHTS